ncbi:hypothetical protein BDA99DRAFT_593193 [Phascolomyces articulosus]|uniref:DDE Tnp4 domain-containing protein n=1 Tax=Phascolomyces articulosus TaxID=60185 RepID=A0AAD5PJB3_9FUNG|nr:hypothetical protein BDA99DRAFT_593193 [Phascolomyces articulosus]
MIFQRRQDDIIFRIEVRMKRTTFEKLLGIIEDGPIFATKEGKMPQMPARLQLGMTLRRLGHGMHELDDVAIRHGFGKGTVVLYTDRVICALVKHVSKYLFWPKDIERVSLKQDLQDIKDLPFEDCVGIVDGMYIVLQYRPTYQGSQFFNRKKYICI